MVSMDVRPPVRARRPALLAASLLAACGGSAGGGSPGTGPAAAADWVELSVNGGATVRYAEASGLLRVPPVACDPRVDWAAKQVVLQSDHVGGAGTGFRTWFELLFPGADAVGTYTVAADAMQAFYVTAAGSFQALPLPGTLSGGSVTVTRSDTRIAGLFSFQLVDGANRLGPAIQGRFDVKAGVDTSCP